jgi:hypothetical protein
MDRRSSRTNARPWALCLLILLVAVTAVADPQVKLGTGGKMCAALTAADFKAVGLAPDPAPPRPPNSTEPGGAYCTYTKAWVKDGGIEFDIFDSGSDAKATLATILGDAGPAKPAGLTGVEESVLNLSADAGGTTRHAFLAVRDKGLVFTIAIPTGPKAKEQLFALARLVLDRVKH